MLNGFRLDLEKELRRVTEAEGQTPLLTDSMQYSLLDGGKRIRPCLLLAVNEMLGGSANTAMPFACALEMIHCYSLVHDDLPSMDDDKMRRGKPSNHVRFGEANAILAGDGLLTRAALLLAEQNGHDAAKQIILNGAMKMVNGQSLDLNASIHTVEQLEKVHSQKTGALFCAATTAGALLAEREDCLLRMETFGKHIGWLFQLTDDILDAGEDLKNGKPSFVTLCGPEAATSEARRAGEMALACLESFENTAADTLRALIQRLTTRTE